MAEQVAQDARRAFETAQLLTSDQRIEALSALRAALASARDEILAANARDMQTANDGVAAGKLSGSLVKRLNLRSSPTKFDEVLQGISDVASLPDPLGKVTYATKMDEDLELYRISCPIGVLLVIFEARPEVMINIAALAIKSGNAAILKGGKESLETQECLTRIMSDALAKTALPRNFIQTVSTREDIAALLHQDKYIDLVMPRGSNSLVKYIQQESRMAVMGHADGLCSIYLDQSAQLAKAIKVVIDAKISYPAACNAVETLLVHKSLLDTLWPEVAKALLASNIELRLAPECRAALHALPQSNLILQATPEDFDTEFLELKLAVRSVESTQEAIKHINEHSSHHTDAIITESEQDARLFCRGVDSAGVFVNASTRFADGFRYGFGTEVGVSTGKTHARGPVGLDGLIIYKYQIKGEGQTGYATLDYGVGEGLKPYLHTPLSQHRPY
ncbi:uncharacterized protein L969DRAFT_89172 [Mixia osmundae IAM 14324]|uniref:glutamate-5-semialdehyde dehydrogenase n=1 Tax=Mixia osmundae (strain CBS 9802 / IAM 14324 / JCM 22182 / KY 12970) TaxID=764103 RepID=G7DSK5_MIXOS|nr:uncharacterized protein L969DRAFT_89172 [Mixia osmundae IAM 14324]KEI37938.1 hypothetical protein L969DRAFT_89172 [Mixia osmundae IAM 14324]GAA93565.1 hypothetical protein E5Q_00209 [Mixia osmundae IAM 14324]